MGHCSQELNIVLDPVVVRDVEIISGILPALICGGCPVCFWCDPLHLYLPPCHQSAAEAS